MSASKLVLGIGTNLLRTWRLNAGKDIDSKLTALGSLCVLCGCVLFE